MSEDMVEHVALAVHAARGSVGLREGCMIDARAAIAAVEDAVTAHARKETTGEEAALAFHIVANWLHNQYAKPA